MNPLEFGVFSSSHNYYIVCLKGNRVAIFLWRGRQQTLIDWKTSFEYLENTDFENVSSAIRDEMIKSGAVGTDARLEASNIKFTFRPV